ncbi:DUF1127 domain-containing protein [Ruegeria pomeroyi]|nr:DUF1127 domain-containing protein [Ruegeria pomeroyi]NVK98812.1 DUF1127 domain-containing protein [Ruegeria pomeroyi]NVL00648.1 DUF1127 domain-containing protein [Ruegeria pomeroyi]QWV07648.1 DUF1127 domain-containing protein [Ruegeria pomeroyi]HCE70182.1 DUF1127 domain-containing protein [Ruegeria sp.]
MAQSTLHFRSLVTLPHALADILAGIFDALVRVGEANAKIRQINALSALSDAELAERGLRRADIIRRVLSDRV